MQLWAAAFRILVAYVCLRRCVVAYVACAVVHCVSGLRCGSLRMWRALLRFCDVGMRVRLALWLVGDACGMSSLASGGWTKVPT